jgi:hypothetical protein
MLWRNASSGLESKPSKIKQVVSTASHLEKNMGLYKGKKLKYKGISVRDHGSP